MNKIKWIFLTVFLATTLSLSAANTLTVEYLEGDLLLQKGKEWVELSTGSTLSENAVIKLDTEGTVELRGKGVKIVLSKPGIYSVQDYVRKTQATASWNMDALLLNKVKILSGQEQKEVAAVMGVRGDKKDAEDMYWATDDESSQDGLDQGLMEIKSADYAKAANTFEKELQTASGPEVPFLHYYLAICYDKLDKVAQAAKHLEMTNVNEDNPLFFDFTVFKSKILIRFMEYDKALLLLTGYKANRASSSTAQENQVVAYTMALCYMSKDEVKNAADSLKEAYALDPKSEMGKTAKKLLDTSVK
jgi:tetratricopeptide (TPR) repeat protein